MPTTVAFPEPLPVRKADGAWLAEVDGVELRLSNLDKPYWRPEGYTKADLLAYYANAAPFVLPYLRDRPLTLKRMPDGADGEFFYAKQAPEYTPGWMRTAPIVSTDTGKRIDYLLADDTAGLLWLANLGCIEMHPWHSRVDALARPDYAFFDLDPFHVGFDVVRQVALLVRTALDRLGLRGYPRTSGATGMQVYVPVERVHSYADVRSFVGRVSEFIHRADPTITTMEWDIARRTGKVFLDHNMNTEGKNIAATWSVRPERSAPVAMPLTWEQVAEGVEPADFTIATVWPLMAEAAERFRPVLEGGQDLHTAMVALGVEPQEPRPGHLVADHAAAPTDRSREAGPPNITGPPPSDVSDDPGDLTAYVGMRDFSRTPEPADDAGTVADERAGARFVIQHHLATRLHHDLRLERGGTARSWAVPKGLPQVRGLRHLAVQTEDHPLSYMSFEGEIPEGEYGGGPVRIWDDGTYETLEWQPDKVTFRLDGRRERGVWHLFRTGEGRDGQWLVTRRDDAPDLPAEPPDLKPMLATAADEPFDDDAWLHEVKWDGIRTIATVQRPGMGSDGSTRLVSRLGNDLTGAYPELADLWERVLARNAVLDGELVAMGPAGTPSFQVLQHRMHLREPAAVERARRTAPVTLMVFDLLALDGEPLVDLPLTERSRLLDDVVVPASTVARSALVPGNGIGLYEAVTARGLEGIISKRATSPYRPGRRSRDWLKIKVRRHVDCVIGGWLHGEGQLTGRLGSLLVGLWDGPDLRLVGRVGTGFDEAERQRIERRLDERARDRTPFTGDVPRQGRWVEPDLVCTVEYGEVTDGHRLRAPSYKGLRDDAEPRTCVFDDVRR